jgi:hypothetical protein
MLKATMIFKNISNINFKKTFEKMDLLYMAPISGILLRLQKLD